MIFATRATDGSLTSTDMNKARKTVQAACLRAIATGRVA
jgi:hypothetical protein